MADTPLDPAAVERGAVVVEAEARIVKWLRERADTSPFRTYFNFYRQIASAIERLDHLKDRPDDR